MKFDIKYECLNKKCGTYIFGKGRYLDGLNCPRCNGPVIPIRFDKQITITDKEEIKLFDKEITTKTELLEIIEAFDKLGKDYVITKSQREVPEMSFKEYKYKMNFWHVKEV